MLHFPILSSERAWVAVQDFTAEFVDCREITECAELDALVNTVNVQHKTKYLQVLSRHMENDFTGYFAIVSHNGAAVAWTYIFIDGDFSFHGLLSGMADKLYRMFPIRFKTAFVSSPVAEYNAFHIKEEYRPHEEAIISALMAQAFAFFEKKGIKLVIIRDHITRYPSEYLHKEFTHMHFMPGTFLDFECVAHGCTCFDTYLMGLKKKWRSNIRNKLNRRKEELNIEIVNASTLSKEDCVRCHELYFQTRGKQKLKHELLSKDYFCACGDELGENCKMLIAKIGEEIIGFAQLLVNEHDVINVRMGMDYRHNKEYNLYYHLLYENIAFCLKNKKKRLYTSQTCYRPKLEMGAKFLTLHTYVHFTNPLLHKIFAKIFTRRCACYTELLTTERPTEVLAMHGL